MSEEQWRTVPGYAGRYEASTLGRVRSLRKPNSTSTTERDDPLVLRPFGVPGHERIGLARDGRLRNSTIRLVVLETFHGPPPTGFVGFHINGDTSDCRAENLKWIARPERGHMRLSDQRFLDRRFWPRVEKTESCWLWTGARTVAGYGTIGRNKSMHMATRMLWGILNGPIPAGLFLCHHCDNPPCIRPDHLFLGTHADNMADMVRKGRSANGALRRKRDEAARALAGDKHE